MNNELIRDLGLENCDRELPKLGMFVIGDSKFRQIDQLTNNTGNDIYPRYSA